MLGDGKLMGFVPTADAERAHAFYEGKLGFRFVNDDGFAVTVEANGNAVRIVRMGAFEPAKYTVLGWEVTGIEAAVERLVAGGVVFERYPFVKEEDQPIWRAPGGARVAWFRDPDGNVLSLSEHPA